MPPRQTPRLRRWALILALVLIAGCGSPKHAPTSSSGSNPAAPGPSTSTSSPASSTAGNTATRPSRSSTETTTTTSAPHPTGGAGVAAGSGSGGSTNARVPAKFTLASGGTVSPPVVSIPAFIAVQLEVVSRDGKTHQVLLGTPSPHVLTVPAHGRASVLIPGLRAGRYRLEIDGAPRGALSIGGEPGP